MKIHFNHIEGFGKITNQDFIHSDIWGELESRDDPDVLLENGWIPWNRYWYNIRSVRINLNKYKPSKSTRRQHKKITVHRNLPLDEKFLEQMYDSYCRIHRFKRTIELGDLLENSNESLSFEYDDKIVAHSFFYSFPRSMVTLQFITDFSVPKLSLGNISQHYECEFAFADGRDYVYILGGYEEECIYKSSYHGFQWWTGKEWSENKELYKKLCERDSRIQVKL